VTQQKGLQSLLLKVYRDGAGMTCSGRLFQTRGAATGQALSQTVDSRVDGTISADVDDDLSLCLELMSATRRSSSQRYSGAGYAVCSRREQTVYT